MQLGFSILTGPRQKTGRIGKIVSQVRVKGERPPPKRVFGRRNRLHFGRWRGKPWNANARSGARTRCSVIGRSLCERIDKPFRSTRFRSGIRCPQNGRGNRLRGCLVTTKRRLIRGARTGFRGKSRWSTQREVNSCDRGETVRIEVFVAFSH